MKWALKFLKVPDDQDHTLWIVQFLTDTLGHCYEDYAARKIMHFATVRQLPLQMTAFMYFLNVLNLLYLNVSISLWNANV